MKPSNRRIHLGRALTVATLFALALPLFSAAASQDSSFEISDEKLEAVARAYIEIYKINQSYKSKIEAAGSDKEANDLRQAANEEMMEIIEDEDDVTAKEYNDVIQALGKDEGLRERLQAHVDEIQKEKSEKD